MIHSSPHPRRRPARVTVASRSAERARECAARWEVERWSASYEALLADPEIDVSTSPCRTRASSGELRAVILRRYVRQKTRAGELFGERMREIRSKQGLTQQVVAERSEIPQTHVSDLELGFKLPNLLTVIRIAVALDCHVADLTSALDKADLRALLPK